ncbi:MAG TPA: hypothetical protein VFA71_00070 [Terriglobales bacterium]|nr:hypothetical protein [Terriglobales bacterium]
MTSITTASFSLAEKRDALKEVLQSITFIRAEQLRSFLRYICEMEFAGRGKELCESLIGIEAFGRPADYSPAEDASVRRRAGDLRTKLQEVYSTELAGSSIRIELPKGKFVPRFVRHSPETEAEAAPAPAKYALAKPLAIERADNHFLETAIPLRSPASVAPAHPERTKAWLRRPVAFWFVTGWAAGVLSVLLCLLAFSRLQSSSPESSSSVPLAAPLAAVRPALFETGTTYEAEAAGNMLSGIAQPFPCAWCSGGARVRHIGKLPQNQLVFNNVFAAKAGNYEMTIYYVLNHNRSFFIRVNDAAPFELPLTGKSWLKVDKTSINVPLKAGNNRIEFYNDRDNAPDLDRLVIH